MPLASLADAVLTVIGMRHGAHELNAGAVALADRIGLVPVLVLRVILGGAVSAVVVVVMGWTAVAASNTSVVR